MDHLPNRFPIFSILDIYGPHVVRYVLILIKDFNEKNGGFLLSTYVRYVLSLYAYEVNIAGHHNVSKKLVELGSPP